MGLPGNEETLTKIPVASVTRHAETIIRDLCRLKVSRRSGSTFGIYGAQGVGCSTLAAEVFHRVRHTFDKACYMSDIKTIWGHTDGPQTLKQKWSDLRGDLCLLVLDDVDSVEQLALFPAREIAKDSQIIVVSHDREVLLALDGIFHLPSLGLEEALPYFVSSAFGASERHLPSDLQNYVDKIVQRCAGLPLLLTVLGRYMNGKKSIHLWKEAVEKLEKAERLEDDLERTCAKLKLTFDGLDNEHLGVFLDVATSFHGMPLELLQPLWGSGGAILERLVHLGLVKVDDVNDGVKCVVMNELLRTLGRRVASPRDCGLVDWTRVGDSTETWKLLSQTCEFQVSATSVPKLEGLRLISSEVRQSTDSPTLVHNGDAIKKGTVHVDMNAFSAMRNLRFLIMDGVGVSDGDVCDSFPDNLNFLSWRNADFTRVPVDPTHLHHLSVLDLRGCARLSSLPESIGLLSSLQIFLLNGGAGSANETLDSLPESFGRLSCLRHLELKANHLNSLPESFGMLTSLKHLDLESKTLRTLPESFVQLSSLQHFNLVAHGLENLPESSGRLSSLQHLELVAHKLKRLPDSVVQLKKLEYMRLDATNLERLPESFGLLSSLRKLDIDSYYLREVPQSIGHLPVLEDFRLVADSLRTLPSTFGNLSSLQKFTLVADQLTSLPESFSLLSSLKEFCFAGAELKSLPTAIGRLSRLEVLTLSPDSMEVLPASFSQLSCLRRLTLWGAEKLKKLPEDLGKLRSLEFLEIWFIGRVRRLPESLCQLSKLKSFKIGRCHALEHFPEGICSLPSLQVLEMHWLKELRYLPKCIEYVTTPVWGQRCFEVVQGQFILTEGEEEAEIRHSRAISKVTGAQDINDKLLTEFDICIKLDPLRSLYWRERGLVKEVLGDIEGAASDIQKSEAIENLPRNNRDYEARRFREVYAAQSLLAQN